VNRPRKDVALIPDEERFWSFVKQCFKQPRRTLKNNLVSTHYDSDNISTEILNLRAQELSMQQILDMWLLVRA
jgi:16S rRNA A1518/A1519 N6-dimethyltransferase RsmA/KsgA/DIM1 with predicted DNA glycosylase/AP lyase activity